MLVSSTINNFSRLTAIIQLSSIPGTALILDARTNPSAVQQGITACNTAYNAQSGKTSAGIGNYWMHGSQGQTMFNTIVTPNSRLAPWGACSSKALGKSEFCKASSNHPGGANILFGDGSVKFIKDSINLMTWWTLGTRAGGEVISANSY